MNTSEMIEITDADPKEVIKAAYELSRPIGMGMLHYQAGPLDESSVEHILKTTGSGRYGTLFSMDYVKGRAVKLTALVDKDTKKVYIRDNWFDRTENDLNELLNRVGL